MYFHVFVTLGTLSWPHRGIESFDSIASSSMKIFPIKRDTVLVSDTCASL